MAEIFDFYVYDDRRILFPKLEDIMQEDHKVATWRFRIPKILNEIDMSNWAWWFVFVNSKGQEFSPSLTLVDDPDEPDRFSIADYDIDYGISKFPGGFEFSLEAINADTGGEILNEWHTRTYSHKVTKTLQGNQAEFVETESDIISALIVEVQTKVNALVGGATPEVKDSIAEMTDHKKIYVLSTDGNWYRYNGTTWVSGGQYASGVTIDPTLTQPGQAADAGAVGDAIGDINTSLSPALAWTLKKNIDGAGNVSRNNYMALSNLIPVNNGDLIVRKTPSYVNNKSIIGYLSEFNGDTFISRNSFNTFGQKYFISNPNTTHIRLAFGRTSGSGVEITQSDVDTYFKAYVYTAMESVADFKGSAFINRGKISDLGYTSFGQCTEQGYYTFGSSDVANITDLPNGWTAGGIVRVYKSGSTVWQKISNNTLSFVRYGYSGTWYNAKEDKVTVNYVNGSGENQSTERLDIYIPRDLKNQQTLYQMGHCVDTANNADVWRIMFAYRTNYNNTLRKLTMTGEWECALHLDGRDDFSGGIVHGDEVDTSIIVFVDGTLTNISDLNTQCNELKIIRTSNLYDPNDHTTIIAEHGVEYVYTLDGLKINQSIKWKVSEPLTNCFLAMLPIIKVYSKYRYDDTSFDVVENNQEKYSVDIPGAKSVTEYSTDYDCSITISIPIYPEGLSGGDAAMITDNGGINYNKVYFPVCTSGTSQIGELWKSTTMYRNK